MLTKHSDINQQKPTWQQYWLFIVIFSVHFFIPLLIRSQVIKNPSTGLPSGQLPVVKPPMIGSFQVLELSGRSLTNQFNSNLPPQPQPISRPGMVNTTRNEISRSAIEHELMETELYRKNIEWLEKSKPYRLAFEKIAALNIDSFSIGDAVYLVENAYMDGKIPYKAYKEAIAQKADHVRQIIKKEGLPKNSISLNYGIQRLYSRQNIYYDKMRKETILVKPLTYRFDDFQGEKDYSNLFVTKLLATSKGQCHSMPLLYLMIAEQVGAKAYLSLSPQHSFIKFKDDKGKVYNFETTSGSLVSNNWLSQSGFVTSKALQNRTYFDTLTSRKLYGLILNDLLLGYIRKFPYDEFAERIRKKTLDVDSGNLSASIIEANIVTQDALRKIKKVGNPNVSDLPKFPEAYQAYLKMHACYEKVDETGYQDMPADAYKRWLSSIEVEKKRSAAIEEKQQFERVLFQLKKSDFKGLKPVPK